MSRLHTMSRFAEPDEKEPKVFDYCDECSATLVEGQEVIKIGESLFCDSDCMIEHSKTITLGED